MTNSQPIDWQLEHQGWRAFARVPGGFIGVSEDQDYRGWWRWCLYMDAVPDRASGLGSWCESLKEAMDDADAEWHAGCQGIC